MGERVEGCVERKEGQRDDRVSWPVNGGGTCFGD